MRWIHRVALHIDHDHEYEDEMNNYEMKIKTELNAS